MHTVLLYDRFGEATSQMFADLVRNGWNPELLTHETLPEDNAHLLTLMKQRLHGAAAAVGPPPTDVVRMSRNGAEGDQPLHVLLKDDALLCHGFHRLVLCIHADHVIHVRGVV